MAWRSAQLLSMPTGADTVSRRRHRISVTPARYHGAGTVFRLRRHGITAPAASDGLQVTAHLANRIRLNIPHNSPVEQGSTTRSSRFLARCVELLSWAVKGSGRRFRESTPAPFFLPVLPSFRFSITATPGYDTNALHSSPSRRNRSNICTCSFSSRHVTSTSHCCGMS